MFPFVLFCCVQTSLYMWSQCSWWSATVLINACHSLPNVVLLVCPYHLQCNGWEGWDFFCSNTWHSCIFKKCFIALVVLWCWNPVLNITWINLLTLLHVHLAGMRPAHFIEFCYICVCTGKLYAAVVMQFWVECRYTVENWIWTHNLEYKCNFTFAQLVPELRMYRRNLEINFNFLPLNTTVLVCNLTLESMFFFWGGETLYNLFMHLLLRIEVGRRKSDWEPWYIQPTWVATLIHLTLLFCKR